MTEKRRDALRFEIPPIERDQSRTRLTVVGIFAATLASAVLLFLASLWLEGVRMIWSGEPQLWLDRLDANAALQSVSNAAEVVAGVLAIAITVVAIVVELASNRYTHKITQLFVRDAVNAMVMGFFVVTAVMCLWISVGVTRSETPSTVLPFAGVLLALGMVTLSLLLLLPYFAYVFAFLNPINVVGRLRSHTLVSMQRATQDPTLRWRPRVIEGLEELEDVAVNAMEHRDRGIAMASVNSLALLVRDHEALRNDLPKAWSVLDGSISQNPDFVAMDRILVDEIEANRTWFVVKVLRQYHSLFSESVNRIRDVGNLIALNTRKIASRPDGSHVDWFQLVIRAFNSYLRTAINVGDVRSAYYVFHQYRLMAESMLESGHDREAVEIAGYFRYYGQLGFESGQPFLLEAVAYDLSLIVKLAWSTDRGVADQLLDILLQVDRESSSDEHEERLRGVRRAQVQVACFLLERGEEERARRVFLDMAGESTERMLSIRDELHREVEPLFWEFTDRGVNFGFMPEEERRHLADFFEWFGDRLATSTPDADETRA